MSAESNQQGEYFHRGMAEIRGETRESGWTREHVEPATGQRLDQARVYVNEAEREFTEYKSGRIDGRCIEQLGKHLELLDRGMYRAAQWVSATPLERTPKEFQELVRGAQERGLDFKYLTPDRQVIKAAIEKGKQQVPGQQLELPGVGDKAREAQSQELQRQQDRQASLAKAREARESFRAVQKFSQGVERGRQEAEQVREERETQQQERARDQELAKTAEAREQIKTKNHELAQAIEDQARVINSAWDKGEAVAVENVREAHNNLSQDLAAIREAELVQAREDFLASGHTPEEVQAIEPRLEQIREDKRQEIVQGIDTLGVIVERSDNARADNDSAERQREQEREAQREAARAQDAARQAAYERLHEQGRLTESERLHWVGQQTDPHAAVRERPSSAPQIQGHSRDGHGQSRGLDRGR
ncbi:hypothetical protein [Nocardia brasiliensis]|uniref:hypothetical protein n=1 Tax=Nocardia brasiliensis TaxID=37326 RepID=UPI001E5067D1|nr:hypothetical protein [Nocardia brasiliensis]MBF6548694.1 hypothetical protein [Nocardia brasiliensis]